MPTSRKRLTALLAAVGACPTIARALLITNGYSAAIDDRFSSGYPNAPITNTSPTFLAAGMDLSGVGWNLGDPTQSAALLSPRTLLEAAPNPMPTNARGVTTFTLGFLPSGTTTPIGAYVQSATQISSSTEIDIEIGTLGAPLPSSVRVYSILDHGPNADYSGDPLFMYGHGGPSPRLGNNTVQGSFSGTDGNEMFFNLSGTQPNLAEPESGDSQSPLFIPWTNPVTGQTALTIVGAQWQTDFSSFLPDQSHLASINAIMAASGYSLRWTPASIATLWLGTASSDWAAPANWSAGVPASTAYIEFDANNSPSPSTRTVALTADRTVVGIYFKAGPAGRPFTIAAGSILNLGRGGIVNYDSAAQTINSSILFTDYQNWFAGPGGLTIAGTLINNGYLLYFNTTGPSTLSGLLTGTGGLAKDGPGTLTITSSQNFTGPVFAHAGTLVVAHPSGLGAGNITIDAGATVRFTNPPAQAATIASLTMSPGSTLDIDSTVVFPTVNTAAREALWSQLKPALATGSANGAWSGTGITSSAAQSQNLLLGSQVYAVALVRNSDLQVPYNSTTRPFMGVNVNNWSILTRYTYAGDTNLDGQITIDDYLNLDTAYLFKKPALWSNGDFNYDGTIDYKDYALIDNAYYHQSAGLAENTIEEHAAEFGLPYLQALQSLQIPAAPSALPEPASLLTLAVGMAALLTRRKRNGGPMPRDGPVKWCGTPTARQSGTGTTFGGNLF